jgi:hypothetical protein
MAVDPRILLGFLFPLVSRRQRTACLCRSDPGECFHANPAAGFPATNVIPNAMRPRYSGAACYLRSTLSRVRALIAGAIKSNSSMRALCTTAGPICDLHATSNRFHVSERKSNLQRCRLELLGQAVRAKLGSDIPPQEIRRLPRNRRIRIQPNLNRSSVVPRNPPPRVFGRPSRNQSSVCCRRPRRRGHSRISGGICAHR